MPVKHQYKCLNANCPGYTNKNRSPVFVAMNSPQPTCRECGSIKLEDWGVAINAPMIGGEGGLKQSEANLRRIADRYGMTNISNKDGRAAKGSQADQARGEMTNITLPGYGVSAPVDYTPKCSRLPMTARMSADTTTSLPGRQAVSRVVPTHVVAEHKGSA